MNTNIICEVIKPKIKTNFGFGKPKIKIPEFEQGTNLFLFAQPADQNRQVRKLSSADIGSKIEIKSETMLVKVSTELNKFQIPFVCIREENGNNWDTIFDGNWKVSDSTLFLEKFIGEFLSLEMSISQQTVEDKIVSTVNQSLRSAISNCEFPVEEIINRDVLPAEYWKKQFCNWLAKYGLSIEINSTEWSSADAEKAEAEKKRLETLEKIEQEGKRKQQAELRKKEDLAQYEKKKMRIQTEIDISTADRENKLQLLEKKHQKDNLELENEVEDAKRTAEKAAFDHELYIAQRKNDIDAVQAIKKREEFAEKDYNHVKKQISEQQETLEKIAELPETLRAGLSDIADKIGEMAYRRNETITREFKIPTNHLVKFGYASPQQLLIDFFQAKTSSEKKLVNIQKRNLVTRDIGLTRAETLQVNDSLEFEFSTERSGFVTLLNIGTSGSVYLHIPNVYVNVMETKVNLNQVYYVPGELLPLYEHGWNYIENGPSGWEHLAIIISDEPIPVVKNQLINRSKTDMAIVKLSGDEFEKLCTELSDWDENSWAVDVCSFYVN